MPMFSQKHIGKNIANVQSKTYREKYQQWFFLKTAVGNIFINNCSQQEPMWIV
jgi:hypothetical protein